MAEKESDREVHLTAQAPTDLPVLSKSGSNTAASRPPTDPETPENASTHGEVLYPEGGRAAWSVVLGSFLSMVASFGIMNTLGVFQAHLSKNQLASTPEAALGWIFGVYCFLCFVGGILIGPIFDVYGPRWLILVGTFCHVVGLVLFSFSQTYWQVMLSFGILTGMGTCLIFTPAVASMGHWFLKKRAFATGVATTGGSVGGIIFPLIIQTATPRVGFGWAVRIVALLCVVLLGAGNSLIRTRTEVTNPANAPSNSSSTTSISGESKKPAAVSAKKKPFANIKIDVYAFKDPRFTLTTFGVFLIEWGVFVPLTYIVSHSLHLGLDPSFSYQLLAILNAGSFFGRWLPGLIADRWGRFNTMLLTVSLCLTSVLAFWLPTILLPFMPAPGPKALMIVFSLIYGFASGSGISLTPVCVGQICSTAEYGTKFGTCYFFAAFGPLTGSPIAGSIIAREGGGYRGLVTFIAASYIAAFTMFALARGIGGGWKWKAY